MNPSNKSDDIQDLTDTAQQLNLVHTIVPAPQSPSPNPWAEQPELEAQDIPVHRIATPDPAVFQDPIAPPLGMQPTTPVTPTSAQVRTDEDVLSQFDPLAVKEEKDARDAWNGAEGRPPPAVTSAASSEPDNAKEDTPLPDTPATPPPPNSAGLSAFPSLASFARSFTLPRVRPRSIDSPATVFSPTTLASLASQQPSPNLTDTGATNGGSNGSASPNPSADPARPPQFDFQRFLEQMKTRGAEPVAKYLRSFLSNFAKRTFAVNDQVKLINEFLNFISIKMRDADVWKNASDAEFENAMEAMEKLVMNRLYEFTFTPQIAKAMPPRPITTDDLERDRVLRQRIALFGWIEAKHLDVPEGEGSKGFLEFAQQELLKINHYKAPRDKLICILNCCKVIFGLIRHSHSDEGADSFVPILIFVVLKANPRHLLSNVEYINRFRNPERLQSEAGYYLSSLMGAVSFIETMDHTSLSSITPEEFEKNVEEAIRTLPETPPPTASRPSTPSAVGRTGTPPPPMSPHTGEESAQPLSLQAPGAGQGASLAEDTRRFLQKTGDTISKPLNALGRIFSEALDGAEEKLTYLPSPFTPFEVGRENRMDREQEAALQGQQHWSHPDQVRRWGGDSVPQTPMSADAAGGDGAMPATPYKPRVRALASPPSSAQSAGSFLSPDNTPSRAGPYTYQQLALGPSQQYLQAGASPHPSRTPTPSLDLSGLQAEIDRAHEKAEAAARGTLVQIFPGTDREVIDWVLEANNGDLGKSIEQLLEMTGAT